MNVECLGIPKICCVVQIITTWPPALRRQKSLPTGRLTGTIELLKRTLGEQVTVALKSSPDPWLALALPLNLIILVAIWGLVNQANDAQRTSLLYAARSIAAGVDAKLGSFPRADPTARGRSSD